MISNYDPEFISLCKGCWCMTHTLLNGQCGKCGFKKEDYDG